MSHVKMGLPWTSRDILAKCQRRSLVPCPRCPMRTWEYLGHPGRSYAYLALPGISRDVPTKCQLHSLVPCPRCPMCTWDHQGHPKMSQLRASYTALSHVQDVPCKPGITWDIPGYPSEVPATCTQPGPMSYMSYACLGLP